jgi:mono/diheme cytochrome c family protein
VGTIEKQVAITLASILLMGALGVVYTLVEPDLRTVRGHQMTEISSHRGAELFQSQGCVTCHLENGYGTLQGGAGWPLNTTQNQRGNSTELEERRQLLTKTIQRGRGPVMAPYLREEGGPLNEEQINELVAYIQYGQWPAAPVQGAAAELVQSGGAAAGGGSLGAQLFTANGCTACHVFKGQGGAVGPSLDNLAADAAKYKPGADPKEYVRESITTPNAVVVEGFQPGLMPTVPLQPDQVDALVEYLLGGN